MPLFLPHMSLWFLVFSFFVLPLLISSLLSPFIVRNYHFYTIYHGEIYHFYPLTAFGSLLVSFRDCPLACQLLNHYHCFECVGCTTPYSQTKFLVLFLTSLCFFTFLIWIRIKPFHYLFLWDASSGPNPHLPLLGDIPSQQDILP